MRFTIKDTHTRKAVVSYIEQLPEGKAFEVTVTKKRERRTLDQNRLYWLWLAAIAEDCGHTVEELATYFKAQYLGHRHALVFRQPIEMEVSTTTLTKEEMTSYLERIQAFAASELGLRLPNPDDLYFEQFMEQYKHFI